MADSELASKLSRQTQINEGEVKPVKVSQSVYAEFKEFSIPEIKEYRKTFQKWVLILCTITGSVAVLHWLLVDLVEAQVNVAYCN